MSTLKLLLNPGVFLSNIKIPKNIDQDQFPYAIIGGVLLTVATLLYYFIFGKIIGRTTLTQQISFRKIGQNAAILITLLAGIVFASAFVKELYHEHYIDFMPFDTKSYANKADQGILAIAGFLVGLGISWVGGCTFGHALNGVPRRKFASFLAVIIFSAAAYATNKYNLSTKVPAHLTQRIKLHLPNNINTDYYIHGCLVLPFLFFVLFKDKSLKGLTKFILNFIIGVICGLGMMIGGMTQRQNVFQTFNYSPKYWNPSAGLVLLTSMVLNFIIFLIIRKKKVTPVFAAEAENPKESFSFGLIIGSAIFGVGWGLGGLCPLSFYTLLPLVSLKIPFYWGISCFLGIKIGSFFAFVGRKILRRKQ